MALFKLGTSIRAKLSSRFGMLISIFTICVAITYFTLNRSIFIYEEINEVYTPSVKKVQEIKLLLSNSKSLIGNWIFVQSDAQNPEKLRLNHLMEVEYPKAKAELQTLSKKWAAKDKAALDNIFVKTDHLFEDYAGVKKVLSTFESYNDPMLVFEVSPKMQDQGSITLTFNTIVKDLDEIAAVQSANSKLASTDMTSILNKFKTFILIMAVFTIVFGVVTTINTIRTLTKPISAVKDALVKMGKGEISDKKLEVSKDELGEMSAALNYLSDGLKITAAYADKVGNGDFNASFQPLSENDVLGNSLIEMGKKLKMSSEEEKRRIWVATGLTKFADILRSHTDVAKLSSEIICNLIRYIEANQGGLFLVNQDHEGNRTLEMTACYAYERKKFLQKTIHEGEGLLGQCLLEKDIIYMTEIPDQYIEITSGLGGANPNCIIIQPLIVNDEMIGAIEIASFKVFDTFELDFLGRLSENIAGVISSVQVNERTVKLLQEAKQAQEAMNAQEEELRQNLEELTTTQEEMFRKEQAYLKRISQLEPGLILM